MPRKRVHLDPDEMERLARLGATVEEAANLFGLAQSSMSERLSRPPLKERWLRGQAGARLSVRRTLMLQAEQGNIGALVWLSKTLCRDQEPPREVRTQNEISGDVQLVWTAAWGGYGRELPAGEVESLAQAADDGEPDSQTEPRRISARISGETPPVG